MITSHGFAWIMGVITDDLCNPGYIKGRGIYDQRHDQLPDR